MKLIVGLLIVGIAYTQAYPGLPSTIPVNQETGKLGVNANGKELREGATILNKEQVEYFTSPLDTRKARKGEEFRWPNGRIPYTISKSSEKDRDLIKDGLKHWMDNTCIKFEEVEDVEAPHLIFREGVGCNSKVGMQDSNTGQNVSIGENCKKVGTVIHEVGHAVGFYHEISRPDRDDFVELLWDNMIKGKEHDFVKEIITTYGIPYDLNSIMHYALDAFSENGRNTIVPLDIQKTFLIGQEEKLSFYDRKLANIMYKCNAECTNPPSCSNEGYVDHNCRCVCPDEFKGKTCQTPVKRNDDLRCGGTFTSPTTIQTLNYPNDYPVSSCVWLFKAPPGKKVQATFVKFDLMQRNSKDHCKWDFLEIRTENRYEGEKYCENDLKNNSTISEGNEMALLFRGQYKEKSNTGFKAKITFV